MTTINDMLMRFRSFDMVTTTSQIMKDNEQDVVELNRQQLLEGVNRENDGVGEYRSPSYALMKERMNPRAGFGNVDLKLSGSFYDNFHLAIDSTEYAIFSTDWKTNKLMGKYGVEIFGLSPESRLKLWRDVVKDKLVESLASHTGCTTK